MSVKKYALKYALNSFLTITLVSFFSPLVWASEKCQHFKLTSYVTLLGPAGPAVGFAEAVLKDGTILPVSATGEITSTTVNADGTINMRVRELDDWGVPGTTIGLDRIKLIPTEISGEFELKIKTFIVGESGSLENAFGFYKGRGAISFNDGTLTHSGRGKICNFKKKHIED